MKNPFDYNDMPNPVEHAAQIASRSAHYHQVGRMQSISLRLEFENHTKIAALSEMSGVTRSEIVNRVLSAGLYAIYQEFNDNEKQEFNDQLNNEINKAINEMKEKKS